MEEAAALTGFRTGGCRGSTRASRRVVTRQHVKRCDRYYAADPFRRWNDSMPGTGAQTALFKSLPITSGPIVGAVTEQLHIKFIIV